MSLISTKLRNSAKGQPCAFCIPGVCNGDPSTTVLAHIRDEHKGLGNKANDISAAFACSACHDHYDQHRMSREDELFFALRALQRTHEIWVRLGLMVVPVDVARVKPSTKILPRRHIGTGEIVNG